MHGHPTARPRRALPARTIDLIRDGVPDPSGSQVWSALLSTANSAIANGHSWPDWYTELGRATSGLGRQLRVHHGRERPAANVLRDLQKAWAKAEQFIAEHPPHDGEHFRQEIEDVARWYDGEADLSGLREPLRLVLGYAIKVADRNGTNRPALPHRGVSDDTGLSPKTVRIALEQLHELRLLVLEVPGRSSGPDARRRRANLYRLPSAEVRTAYMPRASLCAPDVEAGAISMRPSASPADPAPTKEQQMTENDAPVSTSVSLTAASPAALVALIELLQRSGQAAGITVDVDPAASATDTSNGVAQVVPLRPRRAG